MTAPLEPGADTGTLGKVAAGLIISATAWWSGYGLNRPTTLKSLAFKASMGYLIAGFGHRICSLIQVAGSDTVFDVSIAVRPRRWI